VPPNTKPPSTTPQSPNLHNLSTFIQHSQAWRWRQYVPPKRRYPPIYKSTRRHNPRNHHGHLHMLTSTNKWIAKDILRTIHDYTCAKYFSVIADFSPVSHCNLLATILQHADEDDVQERFLGCLSKWVTGKSIVKVDKKNIPQCLTKHHAMQTYGQVEAYLHAFLTSVLHGGKWFSFKPGLLCPEERTPVSTG
jgi:hypothetical protein